jgi:hypothetical protein
MDVGPRSEATKRWSFSKNDEGITTSIAEVRTRGKRIVDVTIRKACRPRALAMQVLDAMSILGFNSAESLSPEVGTMLRDLGWRGEALLKSPCSEICLSPLDGMVSEDRKRFRRLLERESTSRIKFEFEQ